MSTNARAVTAKLTLFGNARAVSLGLTKTPAKFPD